MTQPASASEEKISWFPVPSGDQLPDNFADCSAKRKRRFCRFVQAFPLTASGKVKKFELREMLVKEMGLEVEANIKTA